MGTFISHGSPEQLGELAEYAMRRRPIFWTVLSSVSAGSRIIFYLRQPVSAFVAEGIVTKGKLVDGKGYGWPGKMMAPVRVMRMADCGGKPGRY